MTQPPLSWEIRKRIALGTARGLAYLHDCTPKIIHCDVKAANILLDEEFEALVGDFGLAKLTNLTVTHGSTSRECVTYEYMAPEYLMYGGFSDKTDVFSYGVFLLELIIGQRVSNLDRYSLDDLTCESSLYITTSQVITKLMQEKKWETLVDANLQGKYLADEVEHLLHIYLLCTRDSPMERPKMSDIVRFLSMHIFNKRSDHDPDFKTSPRSLAHSLPSSSPAPASVPAQSQQMKTLNKESKDKQIYLGRLKCFSLTEIVKATDNFNQAYIIGKGAFGRVYKGKLPSGYEVAIKRLEVEKHTEVEEVQFQTEIEMSGKANHRNLLRLLGLCVTPTERILVYPLMINGSVASWLRGRTGAQPPLSWESRKRIALGVAKGLAYLHDDCKPKIIHRDVKAANILLDEDFEAIVADFGLVKFLKPEDTHVTTAVRGTFGYIAPEYVYSRRSSVKTDVYGYGATLMELISGKRPSNLASLACDDEITFTDWVEKIIKEKKWEILVDTNLQGNYVKHEVERFIQVSLLCTQRSAKERPKMLEVLRMLEADDNDLAARWEEWQKMLLQQKQTCQSTVNRVFSLTTDSIFKLESEELSAPR